jgi:heme/copper-type cytochrome/quinol oxidase subunit 2
MKRVLLTSILLFSFVSILSAQTEKSGLKNVTVEEFKTMFASKDFILIDAHTPEAKHLAATDEFIPYDRIKENLDKLPNKNQKIVVYCRSGRMSEEAGQELVALGYTDVYNVLGGFIEMKKVGIPIDGPDRIIYISAKKFSFDPDTINLKLNDKVKIIAKSEDTTHGLSLGDFAVNQEIWPGKRNVIEFTADKKGEFDFKCFLYCGSGHSQMRGKVVVE